MNGPRCLSGDQCPPTQPICKTCQEAYERNVAEAEAKIVRDAVTALESRGWSVQPPKTEITT